jgi:predicted ribosomally synthesized peptide with nif11-like leader
MSKEAVREFFQFIQTDDVLQEQIKNVDNSTSVIQLATEKGYKFTEEELQVYMQEAIDTFELSEDELLAVAGGSDKTKIKIKQGLESEEALEL